MEQARTPKHWFTSDSHLGHGNIIKYCCRPFLAADDKAALERDGVWHKGSWKGEGSSKWRITDEAIKMMNDHLIGQINKHVHKDDVLWHLGDFAFANKKIYYDKCFEYRERINCRTVNIVWGNHDHRNIRDLFTNAYDLYTTRIEGQQITMCHYAMAIWEDSHRGSWCLYGHSHSGAEVELNEKYPNRRSIDVGVDNAFKILGEYRPFSLAELHHLFAEKRGHVIDHHGQIDPSTPREETLIDR
jgi:calcineurin-like phosphoesterase family protein